MESYTVKDNRIGSGFSQILRYTETDRDPVQNLLYYKDRIIFKNI